MADPEFPSVLKRNADWASTFGGASTNLAQRQRYAQDQEKYAEELLGQQESTALNLAKTNATAQNFYFRQKELERKMKVDSFNRDLKHQQERRKDAMLPLEMDTEKARAEAQDALVISRMNKEKRDARNAARVAQDTDAFEGKVDQLIESGIRPGSKAFADAVVGLVATHPFVPSDLRKTWLQQADVDTDPDQLMRDTEKYRDTHDTTLRMNDKGKWSIALTEKKPAASSPSRYQSAYDRASDRRIVAQKAYDKAIQSGNKDLIRLNLDLVKAADADIIDAKNALKSLSQPSSDVPKTLDAETAKSLLKEAAGDKEKARSLAKERGFQF